MVAGCSHICGLQGKRRLPLVGITLHRPLTCDTTAATRWTTAPAGPHTAATAATTATCAATATKHLPAPTHTTIDKLFVWHCPWTHTVHSNESQVNYSPTVRHARQGTAPQSDMHATCWYANMLVCTNACRHSGHLTCCQAPTLCAPAACTPPPPPSTPPATPPARSPGGTPTAPPPSWPRWGPPGCSR